MLRKKIFHAVSDEKFRHRGSEIMRIEALSDAVFAFSVSFLVASLEVPQTFEELKTIIKGAVPFFATVSIVFLFWYRQYIFFRRYGLNDFITILLNLAYLGIILFYVYPLKFLFSILLSSWTGIHLFPKAAEQGLTVLSAHDFPQLVLLFSVGYCVIWFIIYTMHVRAMQFARQLSFDDFERIFTIKEKRGALWNAIAGCLAMIFSWYGAVIAAGLCFLSIPVLLLANSFVFRRQLKRK